MGTARRTRRSDRGPAADLGFSSRARRPDEIVISRHGVPVTTLRGEAAKRFMSQLGESDPQQLMARFTGNYKRGNERR